MQNQLKISKKKKDWIKMHTYLKWFIYSASVKILALKYMSVALLISQNNEYTGKITEFFFF